jgi:DNA-binding NtrC family response regulator
VNSGDGAAPQSGWEDQGPSNRTAGFADVASDQSRTRRTLRILIADADQRVRDGCARLLASDGHRVTTVQNGDEALERLEQEPFDIVLVDLHQSRASGTALWHATQSRNAASRMIVMLGAPSAHAESDGLGRRDWYYLPKPFSATHLQVVVGRAAQRVAARRQDIPTVAEPSHNGSAQGIKVLGVSPAIRHVVEQARRVAATDASVFLTGESGTGKELVAEFIHAESRRHQRPLVAINCAAIPESLLETELFGHRKGAFTGALEDKMGLLQSASGGTFFLDELTQMPLSIQAKLLRVIQDRVVRRVGSDSVNGVVDVRFVVATNQSPEAAMAAGTLREDLFYRLRVFPIHLPPLRERREDIPLLANHFLHRFWSRHRGDAAPVPQFSEQALRTLADHPWRGNVRELQNVIEHGVVLFEPGLTIQGVDIPFTGAGENGNSAGADDGVLDDDWDGEDLHAARERIVARFERRYLIRVLSRSRGNLSKAARIAGVQRTTLYRLMEKYGLHREIVLTE